jgi:hypothetical protein
MKSSHKMISAFAICGAVIAVAPASADDVAGARPGDDAMTCQQIAAELAPYAQQMAAAFTPFVDTEKQVLARGQARVEEYTPAAAAMAGAATASTADPTGLSSKAVGQAEVAMQREAWNRSLAEDKPLADQANQQLNQAVAQATPLQSNARIQRLMELAQQKNCQ